MKKYVFFAGAALVLLTAACGKKTEAGDTTVTDDGSIVTNFEININNDGSAEPTFSYSSGSSKDTEVTEEEDESSEEDEKEASDKGISIDLNVEGKVNSANDNSLTIELNNSPLNGEGSAKPTYSGK